MSNQDTFTVEEIIELIKGVDVDVLAQSETSNEDEFVLLECEIGPINFACALHIRGPFFEYLSLMAFRYDIEDCFVFANEFNGGTRISNVSMELDADGNPVKDEDGETSLCAKFWIPFAGGVSKDHIRYLLEMWIEELVDFYEIDLETDESVEEIDVEIPQSPEFLELPLAERITAYLSLNPSRTAREMGKVLGFDRHEINSLLYKHRGRFVKSGEQPPRWSVSA
jgi:hypothetical protein